MTTLLSFLSKHFKVFLLAIFASGLLVIGYIALLVISRTSVQVLPQLTGTYNVGRIELDWTDPNRMDPLAKQPDSRRELAIWIWYPAQADGSQEPAPYFPAAWAQARDKDQGVGILLERQLNRLVTHSYENAPLSNVQADYPLLIMEPGLGPAIPDYTVLAENLASHGNIVVGINPTYSSNLVVFPDGRVVPRTDQGIIPDNATPAQVEQLTSSLLVVWSKDVIFTLNQLNDLNRSPDSPFYQHLDLAHVGVFGHSFGGATALAVCQLDSRCKAGANLDGTPFGSERSTPLPVPFLLISEDYSAGCDQNCVEFRQIAGLGQPGNVYDLSVIGTRHFNFSDLPLRFIPAVRPIFQVARYFGSIDPARGEEIASAYLLAFFDRYLKGEDSGLLNGSSPLYPEVQFIDR
jgi:predicted dienelactone hydrolase